MEVKYLHKDIKPLLRATDGSGAWDLRSAEDNFEILPFGEALIHSGVAMWLVDKSKLGLITVRSGTSDFLTLKNAPAFIDSDYQGEIMFCLINRTTNAFKVDFNDRLVQMAIATITPPEQWNLESVKEFTKKTGRGDSGWGHSGVK